VYRIKKLKKLPRPKKGCIAREREREHVNDGSCMGDLEGDNIIMDIKEAGCEDGRSVLLA
jgi:hypothetical protein